MNHLLNIDDLLPTIAPKTWQQQLVEAFDNIQDLCQFLHLSIKDLPFSADAQHHFAFKVPLSFAERMEKGNPYDPLLLQILPVHAELSVFPGFQDDPVGDLAAAKQVGVLHKYHGRVLLINTGTCAIHCRYCFRRNFPYQDLQLSKSQEQAALDYIHHHAIEEVILSGGDPLVLNDTRLAQLFTNLEKITSVKRIRIHSRLPIVLPDRISPELLSLFAASSKKIVLVLHCNHANELSHEIFLLCQRLQNIGVTLLNQSVLLKAVNDHVDRLCHLSERLFAVGIMPYYLHLLDRATGTAHFEVSKLDALAIYSQLQIRLPGYLVPKLVTEQPGELSKQLVFNL